VTIFGTGLGGTVTGKVTSSSRFTAASKEIKVVYLPASATIEKGTILQGERPIANGYRLDVSQLKTERPGLLLLRAGMQPPVGEIFERFELSGDPSGALRPSSARTSKHRATT
jgi:hypothetical protein